MNKMKETLAELEDKMDELQKQCQWKANESSYFREGGKLVINNRRLLAWTYVIGFYLPAKFSKQDLFNDWQAKLEEYTDSLHELLEKPIKEIAEKPNDHRSTTLAKTKAVQKFYSGLMNA